MQGGRVVAIKDAVWISVFILLIHVRVWPRATRYWEKRPVKVTVFEADSLKIDERFCEVF